MKKRKCLIYVLAYNHEKFILKTLNRIPSRIYKKYNLEILVSDDFSSDNTVLEAKKFIKKKSILSVILKIKAMAAIKK